VRVCPLRVVPRARDGTSDLAASQRKGACTSIRLHSLSSEPIYLGTRSFTTRNRLRVVSLFHFVRFTRSVSTERAGFQFGISPDLTVQSPDNRGGTTAQNGCSECRAARTEIAKCRKYSATLEPARAPSTATRHARISLASINRIVAFTISVTLRRNYAARIRIGIIPPEDVVRGGLQVILGMLRR
jgi:hypothetical protein